ncbi:DUF6563 family protein [uncultured Bacteroides sp.]|uniref:DUF6563 family protein n=1 Tax=uncultured Bacteroides sp. TaxID=162156 RepID=UPI002AA60D26|nr:DUF6563 family protein [uncultured Bacteroides sp.]
MKRLWIIMLFGVVAMGSVAQNRSYLSLKNLLADDGDTLGSLRIEKRAKNQLMMTAGGDYKIVSSNESLNKRIKSRYYAMKCDGKLFINCRKIRFKHFRFGTCYAGAMWVGTKIYFCAVPVGPAAVSITSSKNNMGDIGQAIASSSLVSERVFYEIDSTTGKIDFVGKDKMCLLLKEYPDLLNAYLSEKSEDAEVTGKYLQMLQQK